ncbi:MAG: pentapeptide repeat-containing protein [Halomonas sp.]|uniref:pentapeptide repeat-containing protein n=1 Tax=unclassified Halomonas TaxID=2609666 RepID=UPI003CF38F40
MLVNLAAYASEAYATRRHPCRVAVRHYNRATQQTLRHAEQRAYKNPKAVLKNAVLKNVDFRNADLRNADLETVVRERLVGFCHTMHVFTLLNG